MRLVIDTSALVSIETVNLVSKVLKYFRIIISDTVKQELSDMEQYEDEHGKSAKRILGMIEKNEIIIKNVKNFARHDAIPDQIAVEFRRNNRRGGMGIYRKNEGEEDMG